MIETASPRPRRVRRCPECGDNASVKRIVYGMPAGPPTPEEEERLYFAGCVIESEVDENGDLLPTPEWTCSACEHSFA